MSSEATPIKSACEESYTEFPQGDHKVSRRLVETAVKTNTQKQLFPPPNKDEARRTNNKKYSATGS